GFVGQLLGELVFPGEKGNDLCLVGGIEKPALGLYERGDVAREQHAILIGPRFPSEGADTLIRTEDLLGCAERREAVAFGKKGSRRPENRSRVFLVLAH